MKIKNLEDLLLQELRDLYSAEKQLLKALPKMAKAAQHSELKNAFEEHLAQTEEQGSRLEQASEQLEQKVAGVTCKGMKGIIEEGKEIEEDAEAAVIDAGLISAAQKVEHYEIAGYGTARALAEMLGHDEIVSLLEETLEEEKDTDLR